MACLSKQDACDSEHNASTGGECEAALKTLVQPGERYPIMSIQRNRFHCNSYPPTKPTYEIPLMFGCRIDCCCHPQSLSIRKPQRVSACFLVNFTGASPLFSKHSRFRRPVSSDTTTTCCVRCISNQPRLKPLWIS